jgi:alpha-D-xyloside xylohydrolase
MLIERYCQITGLPRLMPEFGYGLTFVANMSEDAYEVLNDGRLFRDRGIPCDLIGPDPQWMKRNYDFSHEVEWNQAHFMVPEWGGEDGSFLGGLARTGFKLSLRSCCNDDLTMEEERQVAQCEGRGKDFPAQPDA